jgi:hypothetical protein
MLLIFGLFVSQGNAMDLGDNEDFNKKEQSIIMSKKDFSIIKEEELIEYVSSYFDRVNSVNILDEGLNYDEDKLRALAEKTGLNISTIDKRVGRVVLEYDNALSFGTGSFLGKKIFTNAHVLQGFPLSNRLIFEQGRSLVLQENFDFDATLNCLKKYKDSFLNMDLYEKDKERIEKILQSSVLSVYEAKNVHILKNYFYNIRNHDIGYIDSYTHDEKYENYSSHSFNDYQSNLGLQQKKIFKLTHYPLGIPIQRTSYGLLDFKTQLHRMHTLGGSSGSLILDYFSNPIGFHSAGTGMYYRSNKTGLSFSESGNAYQDLSSFGEEKEYLTLNKKIYSQLFSRFNNKILKGLLIMGITKNRVKMRGIL